MRSPILVYELWVFRFYCISRRKHSDRSLVFRSSQSLANRRPRGSGKFYLELIPCANDLYRNTTALSQKLDVIRGSGDALRTEEKM